MGWLQRALSVRDGKSVLLGAKMLVGLLVAYFVFAFLYVALSRMNYRFALEWLEGGSLVQVQRLLAGQPLYAPPTFDYVALIYSPLYYYLAFLFAKILGFSFLPLRLVSFFSTLGCAATIYLILRKHTANPYVSLMAAGSFLAFYGISDSWFDLARVDMLALFLALLAVWLMQVRSLKRLLWAAAALSLACLSKQTFWLIVPPVLVYAFFLHGRQAWVLAVGTLVISAVSHLVLNSLYQGWYAFFVYAVGFGQGGSAFGGGVVQFFRGYWFDAVLRHVPVLFLLFGMYLATRWHRHRHVLGIVALASGMIVLSWLGILNKGGYNNVLIPSYSIFLICTWLLIAELLKDGEASQLRSSAVLLLYAAQLILLLYPVAPLIPTKQDFEAGQALVEQIQDEPGDVYLPYDNYLALYAGKEAFAGIGSLGDLNQVHTGPGRRSWNAINSELRERIKNKLFSMIILDENAEWGSAERFYRSYYQPSEIPYQADAFFPVAGWQIRPSIRYTPIGAE